MTKPTLQNRYVPDAYINQIKFRVPRRTVWIQKDSPIEANFASWEEAHRWLIEDRQRKVDAAKFELASAERQLAKAKKMRPKSAEEPVA